MGGDEKLVILICIDISSIIDTGGKALQPPCIGTNSASIQKVTKY